MIGKSLPSWLIQSESVLLRQFVRSKSDPLVEEVELLEVNPSFAKVRFPDGKESNVSISCLAPCPQVVSENTDPSPTTSQSHQQSKSSNSAPLESSLDTLSKNKKKDYSS